MNDPTFSQCPNCSAPFPVIVCVESGTKAPVPTDLIIECTCYRCGANLDLTLKLGNLDEFRRRVS